jgi:fructoselysine-6-P-deglycase FrlB-like protein
MASDMDRQPIDLQAMTFPDRAGRKIAFVGSGDSYVAALAACYLSSSGRAQVYRPPDIAADPATAEGRNLYFVSVSGMTRANVLAARAARRAGLRTVAVSANVSSPLARACDSTIKLGFHSAGVKTAGTIGFTACLLVCAALAMQEGEVGPKVPNVARLYGAAKKQALLKTRHAMEQGAAITVLGDSLLYPAAAYGALKFNEVLGARAAAYPLEDFFHAPLFGLQKGDSVITIGPDAGPAKTLKDNGFASFHIRCSPSKDGALESLLYAVFAMQHIALGMAKKLGLQECYFVRNKKLLKVSSDFIYS